MRNHFDQQLEQLHVELIRMGAACEDAIAAAADKVDYVVWLDADTLEEPAENTREILVAAAAYFGTTRLIDNVLIQVKK